MSIIGTFYQCGRGGRSDIEVVRRRKCSGIPRRCGSYSQPTSSNLHISCRNSQRSAALSLISEIHAYLDPQSYFSELRTLYRGTLPAVYKGHIGNALGVAYYYGYGTQHSLKEACTYFQLAQSRGVAEGKSNLTRVWQNAMEGSIGRCVNLDPSMIDATERLETNSGSNNSADSANSTADIDNRDEKGGESTHGYDRKTLDYLAHTDKSWSSEITRVRKLRSNSTSHEECSRKEKTMKVNDSVEKRRHGNANDIDCQAVRTENRGDDDNLRIVHGRELFNAGMELFGWGCTESEWLPLFVSSFEKDWFTHREERGKNFSAKFEAHLECRILKIPTDQTKLDEMDVKVLFVYFYYYLLASGKNTFDMMPSNSLALLSEVIDSRANHSIALWQLLLLRGLLKAKILGFLRGALADLSSALDCCDDINRKTDLRLASLFVIKQVMCRSTLPYNTTECDLIYAEGGTVNGARARDSQKCDSDKNALRQSKLAISELQSCNLCYSHRAAEYLPEELFQLLCISYESLISALLSMPLSIEEPNLITLLRSEKITIAFPMISQVLGPSASYMNKMSFPKEAFRHLSRMVEIANVLQRR